MARFNSSMLLKELLGMILRRQLSLSTPLNQLHQLEITKDSKLFLITMT